MQNGYNPLMVLGDPYHYKENDVQAALEALWPCLSLRYPILIKPHALLPNSWRPDIVAINREETACLVTEIKGMPPAGTQNQAVTQVVGYAEDLQRKYRKLLIQPMVIGPYGKYGPVEYVHRKSADVIVVNLQHLGRYLLNAAVSMMREQGKRNIDAEANGCLDVMLWSSESD